MAKLETVMQNLKTKLDDILYLVAPGSRIALVDEPIHRNIGDHLIQWGAERFFNSHGMRIIYRASTWDYRTSRAQAAINPGDVIICQGGGHLGDLYPHHQRLREQVIRDFPENRIVVLPQSIYFQDPEAEQRAVAVSRSHKDLHLCLRDQRSFDMASGWGCTSISLLPDMVHALWPLENKSFPVADGEGVLYLIRKDREGMQLPAAVEQQRRRFIDWSDLLGITDTGILAIVAAGMAAGNPFGIPRRLLAVESHRLIRRAIVRFSPVEHVITSRLHALLLGLLMGKRVTVLNTLTGKTISYCSSWLFEIEKCSQFDSSNRS
ncbi:MAG: polysaccharide pyruvyl transferase family protein [Desulfocapsa sp.]|nr:polysaccharide pyruvyl transferase family protein [Desulfocapsa sp.]